MPAHPRRHRRWPTSRHPPPHLGFGLHRRRPPVSPRQPHPARYPAPTHPAPPFPHPAYALRPRPRHKALANRAQEGHLNFVGAAIDDGLGSNNRSVRLDLLSFNTPPTLPFHPNMDDQRATQCSRPSFVPLPPGRSPTNLAAAPSPTALGGDGIARGRVGIRPAGGHPQRSPR